MIIFRGSYCENMVDESGNKPRMFMSYWKIKHLGLIKIYLGYELYDLINPKTNKIVNYGKHLTTIEIKWSWK